MKFASLSVAILKFFSNVQAEHVMQSHGDYVFKRTVNDGNRALSTFSHHRDLQMVTAECFQECVKQQMTADQCIRYIEQVLGPDLSNSIIPDLQIVVSEPRPPSVKANSYFMVGIPTNVQGEVKCDLFDGVIKYRDAWVTDSGSYSVPEVDCSGLNADECCDKFQASLVSNNIPKHDVNGNCLVCWAHQETLVPKIGADGSLVYLRPALADDGTCKTAEVPRTEIQAIDDGVEAACASLRTRIENIIGTGGTCDELTSLQRSLLLWARSFPPAMAQIAQLLCGYCDDVSAYHPLPDTMIQTLRFIQEGISGEVNSDTNQIVIYTDNQGYVMESPSIGGDRSQLDIDHDDPDCDPNNLLQTPPLTFANGTVIPEDTGVCDALALSEQSMPGAPCNNCRKCLLSECHWQNQSTCLDLMSGKIEGTSDQWLACLASQGISITLKPGTTASGFTDWCSCALKCEDSCLKENLGDLKAARIRECTAEDMSKRSEDNEQCHNCRVCLQSQCTDWNQKLWCSFLIKGLRNGTTDQWLACLETNGASKDLGRTLAEGDLGQRDTWGRCGRKCDPACYKQRVVPLSSGQICLYEDLAKHSAIGEYCQGCRSCMMRTCTYWKDMCYGILMGTIKGTADNWNWCLNNCGRGLTRFRHLMTNDGLGTARSTWCECARECDDRCFYPDSVIA